MFIGHFGVAFGAKSLAPRSSLGTLFTAAQFVDLLWPVFLLLGLERVIVAPGITRVTPLDFVSYPYTHSLLFGFGWSVLFGAVYWLLRRYTAGAIVAMLCVVSHWFLDLLVHRPDLPLTLHGDARVGLGLWNSIPATLAVEFAIFGAGVFLYMRQTTGKDRIGTYGLAGLVVFLVAIYGSNLVGPPPPSAEAIAWVGHAQWLIVLFAFWVDRHRRVIPVRAKDTTDGTQRS